MASFQAECSSEWLTAEPRGDFWVQPESSDVTVEDVLAKENRENEAGKKVCLPGRRRCAQRILTMVYA